MRVMIAFLAVVLISLQTRLWLGEGSWEQIVALERDLTYQQQVNDQLEARNEALARDIRALKQGVEVIEERARTEFGMIKENETFYLILND